MRPDEKPWKKKLYVALILLVLISSILGFTFSAIPTLNLEGSQKIKMNGTTFQTSDFGLTTTVDGQDYDFAYRPEDLSDIQSQELISALASTRMAYFTSDANSTLAIQISGMQFDIARMLDQRYNTVAETAFLQDNPFGKKAITCSNATLTIPVIQFIATNDTFTLSKQGNCFTVQADSDISLQKMHDKILYGLLKVG